DINPALGLATAKKAVELSLQLNDKMHEAKAYRSEGINYIRLGDDSSARISYNKSLQIFSKLNNDKEAAQVLYHLGEIAFNQGDYYLSLDYLKKSGEYFEKNDSNYLENIFNSTATIYHSLANYSTALQYY